MRTYGYPQFSLMDRWFEDTNRQSRSADYFPAYDMVKTSELDYRITVEVPGYSIDDLNIESHENVLSIWAEERAVTEGTEFIYHGIRKPAFRRQFQLGKHVEVTNARLENGLLHIELKRELPEELKPRRIEVKVADGSISHQDNFGSKAA